MVPNQIEEGHSVLVFVSKSEDENHDSGMEKLFLTL